MTIPDRRTVLRSGDYDHDWTVVLDDWIDGTGYTPDQVLDALRNGMGGMPTASPPPGGPSPVLSGARSALLGGDAGDVRYPWYLINGRVRTAPRTFAARPGQRARIRFINAAADTSFRVALGGHQMSVTTPTATRWPRCGPARCSSGWGSATTSRSRSAMACSR